MALLLYSNPELTVLLTKTEHAGKVYHRLELPRNSPGETVSTKFYVYNDSHHPIENMQILHNNTQVDFIYKDTIRPREANEVTIEWKAPITVEDALSLFFTIEAVEVAYPKLI